MRTSSVVYLTNIISNSLYQTIRNNIEAKKTTKLVLLFHKKTIKLVFLWPIKMNENFFLIIKFLYFKLGPNYILLDVFMLMLSSTVSLQNYFVFRGWKLLWI